MARFNSILETVGNTPVVRLNHLAPEGIDVYVKAEAFNPMGSVKDRLAMGIIEAAEASGELKPGQTVIEATSGNTGIGMAMVCAAKGYPLVCVMAESFSVERRRLLRFLGAKVVLTPAAAKGSGMVAKTIELAEKNGWFWTRQFDNPANPDFHSRTTAPEILADFEGERLDYWVTGFGTGGTLTGVSRVLKAERPDIRIIVGEPDNSQLLGSGIAQPEGASHPNFRPHVMQGWTPDFIPSITQEAVDNGTVDGIIPVAGEDAMRLSKQLASREGIFTGVSGGATLAAALRAAETAEKGSVFLVMLPDTGERYLSTPLFADVPSDMTEDEWEISRSTPTARFDAPAPAAPPPAPMPSMAQVTDEARAFVEEAITGDTVVLFAHQWCEFCWSVRNMFKAYGVEYRSVDMDSAELAEGGWGGQIRAALNERTGMVTVPQVFVAGEFVGGATEIFDAWREGKAQSLLDGAGASYAKEGDDPYSFLPKWLQPRNA
jgi:cysteine synthase A